MQDLVQWCHQHNIQSLSVNSQTVQPEECFLAYVTSTVDRRLYIQKAIERGASAVIYEAADADVSLQSIDVPSLAVFDLANRLVDVAQMVYGNASQSMTMLGVTGTNGKSSIVYYLAQALTIMQQKAAMIGTFGNGFIGELQSGANTTPGVVELYQRLRDYQQQGAEAVAMEVSSHALAEQRVAGLAFDVAIFTQLSRDHLDYHGTMQAYKAAKQKLFDWPGLQLGVFNIDDGVGLAWAQQYASHYRVLATSIDSQCQWPGELICLRQYTVNAGHTELVIETPWGEVCAQTRLIGQFNLSNLLAVVAVLGYQGVAAADIAQLLPQIEAAPGRMQSFGDSKRLVVDYAHTPDALEKALQALRPYCRGRLWCVFGCGGDRDPGKRPLMAQAAEANADQLCITDDNPRTESNTAIVSDIVRGLANSGEVLIEHDREAAIASVYARMQPGDIALIAGKGHEDYQIIGTERRHLDDREIAQALVDGRC